MKLLISILLLVCISCASEAQTKAGFFFGPGVKISRLHHRDAVWLGGQVGWLFDGGAAIGGGLYSLASRQMADADYYFGPPQIEISYYGVLLSFTPDWHAPVEPMLDLLWGFGSVKPHYNDGVYLSSTGEGESSRFMIFEPTASLQYKFGRYVRASAGVGTRFTSGLDISGYSDDDLSHLTWTVMVKLVDL